jgi:hypothetical protein
MPQFRTRQRPPALLPVRPQHVPFDAGRLTSDGGLAWIAQADAVLGLSAALAGQIHDWRRGPVQPRPITSAPKTSNAAQSIPWARMRPRGLDCTHARKK